MVSFQVTIKLAVFLLHMSHIRLVNGLADFKQLNTMTNVTHISRNGTDDGVEIQDFCKTVFIHPVNCSCKINPELCHIERELKIFHDEVRKDEERSYQRLDKYSVTYASVTVLASVTGLTGNTAVLIMSIRQRKGLSSCKLHIAELGCVNLMFSCLQLFNVIPLYLTNRWIYGELLQFVVYMLFYHCRRRAANE